MRTNGARGRTYLQEGRRHGQRQAREHERLLSGAPLFPARGRIGPRAHIPESLVHLDDVQHYSSNERLKGLSDGAFAIAMMLLAFVFIEEIPCDGPCGATSRATSAWSSSCTA